MKTHPEYSFYRYNTEYKIWRTGSISSSPTHGRENSHNRQILKLPMVPECTWYSSCNICNYWIVNKGQKIHSRSRCFLTYLEALSVGLQRGVPGQKSMLFGGALEWKDLGILELYHLERRNVSCISIILSLFLLILCSVCSNLPTIRRPVKCKFNFNANELSQHTYYNILAITATLRSLHTTNLKTAFIVFMDCTQKT